MTTSAPDLGSGYWLDTPIGVLRQTPDELAARSPLRFQRANDDLDSVLWATLPSAGGRIYALVRHEGSPAEGTEVLVPGTFSDYGAALGEVLSSLKLSAADLTWSHPSVDRSSLENLSAILALDFSAYTEVFNVVARATRLKPAKVLEVFKVFRNVHGYVGAGKSVVVKAHLKVRARPAANLKTAKAATGKNRRVTRTSRSRRQTRRYQ